jgi:hypothetical protein
MTYIKTKRRAEEKKRKHREEEQKQLQEQLREQLKHFNLIDIKMRNRGIGRNRTDPRNYSL